MKKALSFLFLLVALTLMFSVVSYAADGDLVREWTGESLKNAPGNAIKNNDNTRGFVHDADIGGDHPVWGCEVEHLEGKGKLYTMVVQLKVTDDDNTDDDTVVFQFDPKMRRYENNSKVDGPADQPHDVTAKEIRDAKADANGIKTFYYTFGPDQYGDNDEISVECRLRYRGSSKGTSNYMSFDLVRIALYEGKITSEPGNNTGGDNGGDKGGDKGEDKSPKTYDPSMGFSAMLVAAAAFGAIKFRKK